MLRILYSRKKYVPTKSDQIHFLDQYKSRMAGFNMFNFLSDLFKAICCITAYLMSSDQKGMGENWKKKTRLDCSRGAGRDSDAHVLRTLVPDRRHTLVHTAMRCNTPLHTTAHFCAMQHTTTHHYTRLHTARHTGRALTSLRSMSP